MNPVRPFVSWPVAAFLLALGILVFGTVAWALLPVASLPQVEYPVINVGANLPGASAETAASALAAPLERQLAFLEGVESINSNSFAGGTFITVRFSLSRNIDMAALEVQAAIASAAGDLPRDLPAPPNYYKENPADRPLVVMAFTSDVMPLAKIDQYVDTIVLRRIGMIDGVSRAFLADEQKYAVRIKMNPAALAARGLSPEDVRAAIGRASVDRPKGKLEGGQSTVIVGSNDQLFDAQSYRDLILAAHDRAVVRLGDVARVEDGVENDKTTGWFNGKPAIVIGIQRRTGANVVQTVDAIHRSLDQLQATLPPSIELHIVTDRAETIRASLADVEVTLAITIGLVVFVIFLFLRRFQATAIPSVTIPLSLLATLIAMYLLGFTLDNLSLMALTISVGFVVDDAIVVIENIVRYLDQGERPLQAAIKGSGQVAFTILSITLSLVAVFIPVFFMGGITGRLFREFAVTVSVAILASAVISLTLSPVMCAYLLKSAPPGRARRTGRIERLTAGLFDAMFGVYRTSLIWVLGHRLLTLASFVLALALTLYLYAIIPKGFFPAQDNGRIFGFALAAPDTPFAQTKALVEATTPLIRADRDVATVISYAGNQGENFGFFSINLAPRSERRDDVHAVIARLREAVKPVKGVQIFLQPEPEIVTGTDFARNEYLYSLIDADRAELETWAPIVEARLKTVPGLLDVSRESQPATPSAQIVVNRELASQLGVDPQQIDDTLSDAFGARRVAEIFTDASQYYVILEVDPKFQNGADALDLLHVASKDSRQIRLSAFAHVESRMATTNVTHRGQFPVEKISFNLEPGLSIGEAVARIHRMEGALGKPAGLQTSFDGAAEEFERSLASQPWLIAAATLVVYIVLGILYGSFIHPLTILSSLPSAGVGALLALMVCGLNLDVMGLIGIILLIGIVKKNAIMMVDFALQAERDGLGPRDAILEACLVRFRPIMMTTIAAIFGALPLAIGAGAGGELRRPLGIAIVGGLLVSQALTLYTTPVIHLLLRQGSVRVAGWFRRGLVTGAAMPGE
jgi:hydrophobe/amphiphile efflux-1 (HAE1) family protein